MLVNVPKFISEYNGEALKKNKLKQRQWLPFQVLKSVTVKYFGQRYFFKQKDKKLKFATQKNGHSIFPRTYFFVEKTCKCQLC